jgi:phosphatidylserine/phosphatidylglycerophosphate/cardiolipin synthase-like enzyme
MQSGESGNRDYESDYEALVSLKGVTFGELLKRKATEGVLVDVLLWDSGTGSETFKENIHDSLDETTTGSKSCVLNYFEGSAVRAALVPKHSRTLAGNVSHHQNSVVLDSPSMLSGIVLNIGQGKGIHCARRILFNSF